MWSSRSFRRAINLLLAGDCCGWTSFCWNGLVAHKWVIGLNLLAFGNEIGNSPNFVYKVKVYLLLATRLGVILVAEVVTCYLHMLSLKVKELRGIAGLHGKYTTVFMPVWGRRFLSSNLVWSNWITNCSAWWLEVIVENDLLRTSLEAWFTRNIENKLVW